MLAKADIKPLWSGVFPSVEFEVGTNKIVSVTVKHYKDWTFIFTPERKLKEIRVTVSGADKFEDLKNIYDSVEYAIEKFTEQVNKELDDDEQ